MILYVIFCFPVREEFAVPAIKRFLSKIQEDIESRFFMRIHASDTPGVLAAIASVLGKYEVSIAQMIQKHKHEEWAELVIVTSRVKEGNFHDALLVLEKMEVVQKISSVIRVYGEEE